MKTIILEKPGRFVRADIPEPDAPGPGQALVKVHQVGVCGTDLSGFLGKMPFYSYPRIPGHELGVEVLEVGEGVTNVAPGDRCSVEPYMNCQQCFACKSGAPNCCEKLEVLGVHTDGGLRPRFVLPARKLHPSKKLNLEQLALVETLGIGCHAVQRGNPAKGQHVLVIGAGPIGLATIEFVKIAGAVTTVLDMNAKRLEFCKDVLKVEHTVLLTNDKTPHDQLKEITSGVNYPVVIDATGNAGSMSRAVEYLAHTGRLVYVGITTDEVHFAHPVLHRREGSVLASRNALPADFARIIKYIEDGVIDTKPWITHRTPFDAMIDVFPSFTKPETGVLKAMIEVGE
ncbi:MAG TPA: zinc-binding alcohol dehydrogenase family protein [Pirellulales bacterium]